MLGVTNSNLGSGGGGTMIAPYEYMNSTISSFNDNSATGVLDYAFSQCSNLYTVSLPNASYIGNGAFMDCSDLISINIPNVTAIGVNAFYNCYSLSSVNINGPINNIEDGAFYNCTNLEEFNAIINSNYIGNAFKNTGIRRIDIPNVDNCSYNGPFYGCKNLSEINWRSDNHISQLQSNAFYDCNALTHIDLPNLEYIGQYGFNSCYALSYVDFPKLSLVSAGLFRYCSSLASVNLPNVNFIDSNAFVECISLQSVYLMSTAIVSLYASSAFSSTPLINSSYTGSFGSIYVPSSLLASYKTANNWSYFSSRFVGV